MLMQTLRSNFEGHGTWEDWVDDVNTLLAQMNNAKVRLIESDDAPITFEDDKEVIFDFSGAGSGIFSASNVTFEWDSDELTLTNPRVEFKNGKMEILGSAEEVKEPLATPTFEIDGVEVSGTVEVYNDATVNLYCATPTTVVFVPTPTWDYNDTTQTIEMAPFDDTYTAEVSVIATDPLEVYSDSAPATLTLTFKCAKPTVTMTTDAPVIPDVTTTAFTETDYATITITGDGPSKSATGTVEGAGSEVEQTWDVNDYDDGNDPVKVDACASATREFYADSDEVCDYVFADVS